MREKACPGIGEREAIKNGRGKVCVLLYCIYTGPK